MTDLGDDMAARALERFLKAKDETAQALRDLADSIDRVPQVNHKGEQRDPAAVLGEVDHLIRWGAANSPVSRMFTWASSYYEVLAYEAKAGRP